MSIIHEKSPKHCAEKLKKKKKKKKLFFYVSTFLLSILSLVLIMWFILHPRNPSFSLKQAIIHLNSSSSSIHITLLSTNPNNKVGIYYDGLRLFLVHASNYNGHASSLPSFYQHHKETKFLNASFPLHPPTGKHIQPTGEVDLKVTGKLRWKVGTWVSRRYAFNVDCATLMPFPTINVSSTPPLITASKQPTLCSTSISRPAIIIN